MLNYKGYTGQLEVDLESGMLYGRVIDIKDVVTFKGATVEEARRAFEESVDDYLEFCAELEKNQTSLFPVNFHFARLQKITEKSLLPLKK